MSDSLSTFLACGAAAVFLSLWVWERLRRDASKTIQLTVSSDDTPTEISPQLVADFEPHLRQLVAISPRPQAIHSLLAMLDVNYGIRELQDSVTVFSSRLLWRYRLGEAVSDGEPVQVWETCWLKGNDTLFKGTLRRPADGMRKRT